MTFNMTNYAHSVIMRQRNEVADQAASLARADAEIARRAEADRVARLWRAALNHATVMMDQNDGLEPTSALKQAASDVGIQFGEPMTAFIGWARTQPPFIS